MAGLTLPMPVPQRKLVPSRLLFSMSPCFQTGAFRRGGGSVEECQEADIKAQDKFISPECQFFPEHLGKGTSLQAIKADVYWIGI